MRVIHGNIVISHPGGNGLSNLQSQVTLTDAGKGQGVSVVKSAGSTVIHSKTLDGHPCIGGTALDRYFEHIHGILILLIFPVGQTQVAIEIGVGRVILQSCFSILNRFGKFAIEEIGLGDHRFWVGIFGVKRIGRSKLGNGFVVFFQGFIVDPKIKMQVSNVRVDSNCGLKFGDGFFIVGGVI